MSVKSDRQAALLSAARQQTIAALVAGGLSGVSLEELAVPNGARTPRSAPAVRMAISRVRDLLPPGTLPEAVAGYYQLQLPVGAVDAWRLREVASGPLDAVTPDELHHLLRSDEPYRGVAESDLIDRSRRQIQLWQRELLRRLPQERPELLNGSARDLLRGHLELNPYDEGLVDLTATEHARSGDRRAALNILAEAHKRFADVGLARSANLDQLEQRLLDGRADPVVVRSATNDPFSPVELGAGEVGPNRRTGASRAVMGW